MLRRKRKCPRCSGLGFYGNEATSMGLAMVPKLICNLCKGKGWLPMTDDYGDRRKMIVSIPRMNAKIEATGMLSAQAVAESILKMELDWFYTNRGAEGHKDGHDGYLALVYVEA
jgi:hypothetical protein